MGAGRELREQLTEDRAAFGPPCIPDEQTSVLEIPSVLKVRDEAGLRDTPAHLLPRQLTRRRVLDGEEVAEP